MINALLFPGPRAVALYYGSRWAYTHKLKPIAIFLYNLNMVLHACDLNYHAEIGKGLRIIHPVGIVLGPANAGDNLTLGQNTTIGMRDRHNRDGRQTPIIGDNVVVNAGSAIIGPINVGDGVIVGVNAVVLHDCPSGAVMIGVPARQLRRSKTGME